LFAYKLVSIYPFNFFLTGGMSGKFLILAIKEMF